MSDEWWIKQKTYDDLCIKYHVRPLLDAAATKDNSKCLVFISKQQNALKEEWAVANLYGDGYGDVYCNPPNSELSSFIVRAHDQWRKHNMTIMMIMPCSAFGTFTFNGYVWELYKKGESIEIDPMLPRPEFLLEGKDMPNGNRNSYMVVVWRHKQK